MSFSAYCVVDIFSINTILLKALTSTIESCAEKARGKVSDKRIFELI